MSNYYSAITAAKELKATPEEYDALKATIEISDQEIARTMNGDEACCCGYRVDYEDGKIYVFGYFQEGDCFSPIPEFFRLLGSLIAKNGLEHLEFGEAMWCDKPRCASTGGRYFRIRSDGSRWEPKLTW